MQIKFRNSEKEIILLYDYQRFFKRYVAPKHYNKNRTQRIGYFCHSENYTTHESKDSANYVGTRRTAQESFVFSFYREILQIFELIFSARLELKIVIDDENNYRLIFVYRIVK